MSPDPATIALWTSLVSTSRRLVEAVEAALKAAGHPPLAWYDALLELEKAGPEGLRPFQLTERLLLPQYGTSRLIDRLAKAGLVLRESCGEDGRGQVIRLSEPGRALRAEMWPVYAAELDRLIGTRIAPEMARDLAERLRDLGR